jgi:hypothetical protein
LCQPVAGKSRKHPAIAVSTSGDTLIAWAEGTGWQRSGDLAGQVFDKSGKATAVDPLCVPECRQHGAAHVVFDGGELLVFVFRSSFEKGSKRVEILRMQVHC